MGGQTNRRDFLRGLTYAGLGVATANSVPNAYAQSQDEVDAESYDALDTRAFPSNVSVSWIVDRFIQVRSDDAPVIGHEVETTALVLERITSGDEQSVLREEFSWEEFDYTGTGGFEELFSALTWPIDDSVGGDFFEAYDLLWVTGVNQEYYRNELVTETGAASTDQEFYDLYGHTPFIFAAVETVRTPAQLSTSPRRCGTPAVTRDRFRAVTAVISKLRKVRHQRSSGHRTRTGSRTGRRSLPGCRNIRNRNCPRL